jgi:hypothetical protein
MPMHLLSLCRGRFGCAKTQLSLSVTDIGRRLLDNDGNQQQADVSFLRNQYYLRDSAGFVSFLNKAEIFLVSERHITNQEMLYHWGNAKIALPHHL